MAALASIPSRGPVTPGRPPAETWGWAFTILAAGVLTGPLVVGFKERRP